MLWEVCGLLLYIVTKPGFVLIVDCWVAWLVIRSWNVSRQTSETRDCSLLHRAIVHHHRLDHTSRPFRYWWL